MTGALDHLGAMLRRYASGAYAEEAAAELLIGHESWLWRLDFVREFVELVEPEFQGEESTAYVLWDDAIRAVDAGSLPCSTSEAQVLRIAASIAAGTPVSLRDCLGGLDPTNITLVMIAVAHANGRRGAVVSL